MAQRHKKIKIGILGGSFNPPHAGHVHISLMALKKLHLHQVWWVVSPQNPHKSANIKNTFKERIRLCEEITASIPKIKIKALEAGYFPYAKKFYTYNLLKRLNAEYKYLEFYLIIGADNLIDFHKWYEFEKIARMARLTVVERPGYRYKALASKAANRSDFTYLYGRSVDISSTLLRSAD